MESTHVTKENCEDLRIRTGDNLSVDMITGVDGQTAALYLAPPGADVEGSLMNAYWKNYLALANAYVEGKDEMFMYVSFERQQSYNEADISRECNRIAPNTEGILNLYRQYYNQAITEYREDKDSNPLECALGYLEEFKAEQRAQASASKTLQTWFRGARISDTGTYIAEEVCPCGERSMFEDGGLCADCHWEEDAVMKRKRRRTMYGGAIVIDTCGCCGDAEQILVGNDMCGWCATK
jgi:hypothetical protein